MNVVLNYELLDPGVHYKQQLLEMNQEIGRKSPFTSKGLRHLKLLHDIARPHVAKPVNNTLETGKFWITQHTDLT